MGTTPWQASSPLSSKSKRGWIRNRFLASVGQAQMASKLESFNEFMRNQETVSLDKEGGEEGSIHELWRGLSSYLTSQLQVDRESLPAKLTSNNLEHTLNLLEVGASLSYDSMMGVQSAAAEEEVGIIELNVDLFTGLLISKELLSTLDLRLSEDKEAIPIAERLAELTATVSSLGVQCAIPPLVLLITDLIKLISSDNSQNDALLQQVREWPGATSYNGDPEMLDLNAPIGTMYMLEGQPDDKLVYLVRLDVPSFNPTGPWRTIVHMNDEAIRRQRSGVIGHDQDDLNQRGLTPLGEEADKAIETLTEGGDQKLHCDIHKHHENPNENCTPEGTGKAKAKGKK
mmetsp:Transcript_41317/g.95394  ORF Transcript_41317/g.95394 Transcript_41317/m.95394 type:complete len:344 (+) Transcript_41317:1446-2477(+)